MRKISISVILARNPHKRGQSLVELGISMIILLLLLAGAINYGIAFFDFIAIRDAAEEGAMYGSINPPLNTASLQAIIDRVKNSSNNPIDLKNDPLVNVNVCTCKPSSVDCTINSNWVCNGVSAICPGYIMKVTVNYDVPILMPIAGIITNAIHLTTSATSTILKPACP